MSSFYVTTPIYYVNDAPHLGHAYTTIAADALARFHRMRGDTTRFLTGTDEHGLKIEQAAQARGLSPQALADEVVERFRQTWVNLGISNDDFIRTTEPRHKQVVAEMWRRMQAAGDIYLGAYEGWYCVPCEAYYPEGQLVAGPEGDTLCPTHKRPATWLSEPTYFFKLSAYQDRLLAHIEAHPEFVQPEAYKNEIVSFIKSGLRDLSVSRTTFAWGIGVPDDPAHVIYVWIDALTNYYSALADADGRDLRPDFWPAAGENGVVHLIGKDILKFHAVYWPCMLMSAGLPLPRTILCHGWWTVRGEKISKSMPATRVDPNRLAADLGADALRYFVLREVPLGLDGDFSYEALLTRFNSDLANDLGNLVSRTFTLFDKFLGGVVPDLARLSTGTIDLQVTGLRSSMGGALQSATREWDGFHPSKALEAVWQLVRDTNAFITSTEPWRRAKEPTQADEVALILGQTLEAIALIANLLSPVMPTVCGAILGAAGITGEQRLPEAGGRLITPGTKLRPLGILFPRLDDARQAALLDAWIPADARAAAAPAPTAAAPGKDGKAAKAGKPKPPKADPGPLPNIEFDDFSRADLRVARVLTAAAVEGAKKLLRLELDVGDGRPRQVVAGIAEAYAPDALVGRNVIFLANLAPRAIRGVTSEGMILAAGGDAVIGLSAVDVDVPPGTKIR